MVGKVNGKSPQPVQAAETTEVNVSEKQTKTPSELHKGDSESSQIKASASQISAQKAEQSLGGLARQAGLFNYVLPQNSINSTGRDSVTMAVGEDGGEQPKLPKLPDLPTTPGTTMAVGEEDGGLDPNPKPGGGGFTTMAVGEEDGGQQPKLPEPDPPIGPSDHTTVVVGEEDGTSTVGGV